MGKRALAECDICGCPCRLHRLKAMVVKQVVTNILACPDCWNKDHPQLMLGTVPINDPQALRNPRPDQPKVSREIQWGWNPVGGAQDALTPSTLAVKAYVRDVTISVA